VNIFSHQETDLNVSVVSVLGQALEQHVLPAGSSISLRREDFSAGLYVLEFTDKITGAAIGTQKFVFY